MSTPLVSVIIPCRNRAHYLGESLHSVVKQYGVDWECIVVDDGYPGDGTQEIVEHFKKLAPTGWIRCVPTEATPDAGKGAPVARNLGFSEARGKYVKFLDSDDLLGRRSLEKMVCRLEDEAPGSYAGAFGSVVLFTDEFGIRRETVELDAVDLPANISLLSALLRGKLIVPNRAIYRREYLRDAKMFWKEDLKLNQDVDFALQLALCMMRDQRSLLFVKGAPSFWRQHSGVRITRSQAIPGSLSRKKVIERVEKHLRNTDKLDSFRQDLGCFCLLQLSAFINQMLHDQAEERGEERESALEDITCNLRYWGDKALQGGPPSPPVDTMLSSIVLGGAWSSQDWFHWAK